MGAFSSVTRASLVLAGYGPYCASLKSARWYWTWPGGGRYEGTFNVAVNPQSIIVSSSLKGSASRAVSVK